MKKLTKEELEFKEQLKEDKKYERVEKQCEKMANTKPIKERLKHIRKIF